jgi:hypothetical protein
MACIPNPENKKQYRIVTFDNTDETLDFIRRTYPEVLEGHEGATVVRVPGDYLPKERLVLLRTGIAAFRRARPELEVGAVGPAGGRASGDSSALRGHAPQACLREGGV